jgi:nitrite reductase/ring-hydroxylating ferredoxin subunit
VPSDRLGHVLDRVEVGGEPVLVGRLLDGTPVAVGPVCPHQHRPMDGGSLYLEVVCPHHHDTNDPRTGENRYPKKVFPRARADTVEPIVVYDAREEEGWLWVGPRRA